MANYYFPLPALKSPDNALLDFSGLNNAIDKWGETNRQNAMLERQDARYRKSEARAEAAASRSETTFNQQQTDRRNKVMGGIAQSLLDATPDQRGPMLQALRQQDKEFDSDLQKHGYDSNNIDAWAPAVIAMARGLEGPADRAKADADLRLTMARARYYEGGGRTGGASGKQAIIDRLMEDDPNLSYAEALALSQRAPRDDRLGRDRLAVDAAKNALDPEEVEGWRGRFGAPAGPQRPDAAHRPDVNRFNFGGAQRQGSREAPMTPRSQADIDRAPSGTHFLVDGKLMVKP